MRPGVRTVTDGERIMICLAKRVSKNPNKPEWHQDFLAMLPKIRQHASLAFRHLRPEAREEAVQEVICNALRAFVRLVEIKKVDLAYPTVLARFSMAFWRSRSA